MGRPCPDCAELNRALDLLRKIGGKYKAAEYQNTVYIMSKETFGEIMAVLAGRELSQEDEAALEAIKCPTCSLPGMKAGKCVFSHLHKH